MNLHGRQGFTLVELMIAMVVVLILVSAVFATYQMQTSTYSVQREISKMQQGLRGSLYVLTWDLRNGLRDPSPRQRYRFTTNTRWCDLDGNVDNAGQPSIEFRSLRLDNDTDGVAETFQTITYRIRDEEPDGIPGLYRQANPGEAGGPSDFQLVADGIQAIGFAFAYDIDGDNVLERYKADPNKDILWAVDSDNDGRLDAILDTDGSDAIDEKDDTDGDGRITGFDDGNSHLATPASYDQVRMVRIFLLTVSERAFDDHMIDRHVYVIGNQVIQPPQDRFKRRVMTIDVALRNYIR